LARYRTKADWRFLTAPARTAFMNQYNNWRIGKTFEIENVQQINEENGEVMIAVRMDVAVIPETQTIALYDILRTRDTAGVRHVLLSLHRCRYDGQPPADVDTRYFEFP
jgi:hypothetical protein